jgi:hypothetical protein
MSGLQLSVFSVGSFLLVFFDSFSSKTTNFTNQVMKKLLKIKRLKFPIWSLREDHDIPFGGFISKMFNAFFDY